VHLDKAGKLQAFKHEEWIFNEDRSAVRAQVPDRFLVDFSAARGDHVESSADILTVIKAKQASCLDAVRGICPDPGLPRLAATTAR